MAKLCINCRHCGEIAGQLQAPCLRNGYSLERNRSESGSCGPGAVFWERAPLLGSPHPAHLAFLARFRERGRLFLDRADPAEREAVQAALRFRYLKPCNGEAHFTARGYAALARMNLTPVDRTTEDRERAA